MLSLNMKTVSKIAFFVESRSLNCHRYTLYNIHWYIVINIYIVKLDLEIAVDPQNMACDQIFEGVPDRTRP